MALLLALPFTLINTIGVTNFPPNIAKLVRMVNWLHGIYHLKRAILTAIRPTCKRDNRASAVNVVIYHSYDDIRIIISTYSSSLEDLRIARDLLASRNVHAGGLISHRLSLEQFHEGVALMRERAALKVYFQIAGEC
jgi:hypothetical protein